MKFLKIVISLTSAFAAIFLVVVLRGHGESELGDGEITIDTYVDDLHNLLEELNISKVNLIGFSLGSAVAIDFTVKYPQNVES